jgi:hypothetical protein
MYLVTCWLKEAENYCCTLFLHLALHYKNNCVFQSKSTVTVTHHCFACWARGRGWWYHCSSECSGVWHCKTKTVGRRKIYYYQIKHWKVMQQIWWRKFLISNAIVIICVTVFWLKNGMLVQICVHAFAESFVVSSNVEIYLQVVTSSQFLAYFFIGYGLWCVYWSLYDHNLPINMACAVQHCHAQMYLNRFSAYQVGSYLRVT